MTMNMRGIQATAGSWNISNNDLLSQFLPDDNCQLQHLPEKLGLGRSAIFKLDRDLSYIETRYAPLQDLAIMSRMDASEPRMVVTLGLKGHSRFTDNRGGGVVFKEGYTSITTFNASEGSRQYQANKTVTQLRFSMNKSWLDRYFGENKLAEFFNGKPAVRLISHQPISAQGVVAAQSLLSCNVAGQARPLFRRGQAMAILASELGHLLTDSHREKPGFNRKDRELANLARDILFAEFNDPPSVEELSKRVGTNQFKLKQLFHYFFDNTPYGLLLEIRMKKAYQLLQSSRCPVSVAAEFAGYNHASNFSAAFIKFFGVAPKQVSRQD